MEKSDSIYDIAIIGGGIAGAGIARDAALRGFKVILFEKLYFGSGTSSKSSKLIHGGLRYLELSWNAFKKFDLKEGWKNFKFVFSALRETRILERISPDLVKPLSFIVPVYKSGSENPLSIYAGTVLYGLLAFLSGNLRLPRLLPTKKAVLKLLPDLNPNHLLGGVLIWDHWTQDQKLVEAIMNSAVRSGATAHEAAEVKKYRFDTNQKIYEVTVQIKNETKTFWAKKIINASGPWVDKVREANGEKKEDFILPVAGSHIHLRRFTDHSVVLRAKDKRIFFVINIGEIARVGTTEFIYKNPDTLKTPEQDIEYLLCALEQYFPGIHLDHEDILSNDSAIRPLAKSSISDPHAVSREHEFRVGPTGVYHVLGVKLTDYRRAAAELLDKLIRETPEFKSFPAKTKTHLLPLN